MTLIITMLRPEGVWQSADNRVTVNGRVKDDNTPKQLHIICPPIAGGPQVLMGFTGLAEMPDGTPTLRWIEETLRGENRPIMDTIEFLSARLTRDLSTSNYRQESLIITGGIYERSKRFYFEIRNVNPASFRINRNFDYIVLEVDEPQIFVGGSGARHITEADWILLRKQVKKRPSSWEDHSGLLAAINRRVAKTDKLVSPWCQASYLNNETDGASSKRYIRPGEPNAPAGMHSLLFGIDLFQISQQATESFKRMSEDKSGEVKDDYFSDSVRGRP